jgi:anti-sigma factor (TIGR02949 family)
MVDISMQDSSKLLNEVATPDEEVVVELSAQTVETFDYYSCEEAIKRLNDYLDHELQPDERSDVLKHLQICKPCLERFHFEEGLLQSLRVRVARVTAPGHLRARIADMFRQNG